MPENELEVNEKYRNKALENAKKLRDKYIEEITERKEKIVAAKTALNEADELILRNTNINSEIGEITDVIIASLETLLEEINEITIY